VAYEDIDAVVDAAVLREVLEAAVGRLLNAIGAGADATADLVALSGRAGVNDGGGAQAQVLGGAT
jgi:hypothetical protein